MSTQKKRKISRPKRRKGKPRKRNRHQGIRHTLSQILGALLVLGVAYIIYIYSVTFHASMEGALWYDRVS